MDQDVATIVRRFWRCVFDERDLSVVTEMVSPDLRWRGSLGTQTTGISAFLEYARAAQQAMPDLTVTIDELSTTGDQAWTAMTFRATHHGILLGVPGTGRPVRYPGLAVHDLVTGVLTRVWVVADTLDLHRQLVAG